MKHNEIIEVIKLFDKMQIDLIKIEDEDTKLELCKTSSKDAQTRSNLTEEFTKSKESAQSEVGLEQAKKKYYEVKSPMIGNFYRASSPEAKAFVEKGEHVKKGDSLCVIEAMKMINEIKSEKKISKDG